MVNHYCGLIGAHCVHFGCLTVLHTHRIGSLKFLSVCMYFLCDVNLKFVVNILSQKSQPKVAGP